MTVNMMNESDRKWLDVKFNSIENHFKKTCSEIEEVDGKVSAMNDTLVRTEERLNNYLKSNEKRQVRIREWIFIAIGVTGSLTAVMATAGVNI